MRIAWKQLQDGSQSISGTGIVTLGSGSMIQVDTATITNNADVVNKEYVDGVAAGLDPKESVRFATIDAIIGTYSASGGTAGTGNFTGVDFTDTGDFDLDGNTVVAGDRILVMSQADPKQNGIYSVVTAGASGSMERATDHNGTPTNEVSGGNFTFVELGALCGNCGWVLLGDGELALNTDNLVWTQFSTYGAYSGGNGIDISNNVVSVDLNGTSDGTSGLQLTASGLAISSNLGGNGIAQSNGVLSLDLSELTGAVVDVAADSFAFLDATDSSTKLESFSDLATAMAGNGIVASSGVLAVDITEFTVDTVIGATDVLAINDGAMKQVTFANLETSLSLENIQPGTVAGQLMIWDQTGGVWDNALLAVGTGDRAGLAVVNADGSITIGVDIENLAALGAFAPDSGDKLMLYDVSADQNVALTITQLQAYMQTNLTFDNYVSWTLSDGSNTQPISSGNTVTLTDSNGIQILVGATDTAAFSLIRDAVGGTNLATAIDLNSNGIAVRVDDITIEEGTSGQLRVKANGISANELNVAGNGSPGQILSSDGDGSFSWVADNSGTTPTRTRNNSATVAAGEGIAVTDVFGANDPASNTIPSVYVNGVLVYVGQAGDESTADCWFAEIGVPGTAVNFASLDGNENLIWDVPNAGYALDTTDVIEVRFEV